MDVPTAKLDLINWLVNLKDEAIISKLQSIKNSKPEYTESLVREGKDLEQLLDNRLEENTADYLDARHSLKKVRRQYEI